MVNLFRIIKYGWQNFLRNGLLSFSTIAIMILALIVFEGLILFNVVSKAAIKSIENKVDITVYFQSNVAEDNILNLKKSLEGLDDVSYVEYVSQNEALNRFKALHSEDEAIMKTLETLDSNPLLPSLNIKAKDIHNYENIASYLDNPSFKDMIYKVNYAQTSIVINRLVNLVDNLSAGGLIVTLFLTFLSAAVIFNTIRLAIFSNREQIEIMRLVGASNKFVRGPYIVEGIIYGLISALISFLIMIPIINFVSQPINNFVPEINLKSYFSHNFHILLLYQLGFGIFLGILSSAFATRRYLRI
jgi:cell division transport system permease protein